MSSLESKLSHQSKARRSSALREISAVYDREPPGTVINLGGGLPNPKAFPFLTATIQLSDGSELKISQQQMQAALQYGPTDGYTPLVKTLMEFQRRIHASPGNVISKDAWGVLPINGAADGISKTMDMFLDEGDSYLLEVPLYPGVVSMCEIYPKCKTICCETDGQGLSPETVRSAIEGALKKGWPSPKFLYTNPTANNPIGVSTTTERRREIYALACKYDFYIIEDDPYYFIRFDAENPVSSYLSLDTEGRVVRLDSFSKIFSAGMRLGFVTAPLVALERLMLHMQTTQIHPSGIAQIMVSQLFDQWGIDRVLEHCHQVAALYHEQMKTTVAYVEKHLKGVVEYSVPTGGFFLWLRVPAIRDTEALVTKIIATKKILFVHGSAFYPDFVEFDKLSDEKHRQYIRVSFSVASPEEIDEGLKRLREAIDEEIMMKA